MQFTFIFRSISKERRGAFEPASSTASLEDRTMRQFHRVDFGSTSSSANLLSSHSLRQVDLRVSVCFFLPELCYRSSFFPSSPRHATRKPYSTPSPDRPRSSPLSNNGSPPWTLSTPLSSASPLPSLSRGWMSGCQVVRSSSGSTAERSTGRCRS